MADLCSWAGMDVSEIRDIWIKTNKKKQAMCYLHGRNWISLRFGIFADFGAQRAGMMN